MQDKELIGVNINKIALKGRQKRMRITVVSERDKKVMCERMYNGHGR